MGQTAVFVGLLIFILGGLALLATQLKDPVSQLYLVAAGRARAGTGWDGARRRAGGDHRPGGVAFNAVPAMRQARVEKRGEGDDLRDRARAAQVGVPADALRAGRSRELRAARRAGRGGAGLAAAGARVGLLPLGGQRGRQVLAARGLPGARAWSRPAGAVVEDPGLRGRGRTPVGRAAGAQRPVRARPGRDGVGPRPARQHRGGGGERRARDRCSSSSTSSRKC